MTYISDEEDIPVYGDLASLGIYLREQIEKFNKETGRNFKPEVFEFRFKEEDSTDSVTVGGDFSYTDRLKVTTFTKSRITMESPSGFEFDDVLDYTGKLGEKGLTFYDILKLHFNND